MTPDVWTVVIPVKSPARGKSRLSVDGVDRVALARAIALDTVAAAVACDSVAQVVVVTDVGGLVLQAADIPGLRFVSDADAVGLDAAVASGRRQWRGCRARRCSETSRHFARPTCRRLSGQPPGSIVPWWRTPRARDRPLSPRAPGSAWLVGLRRRFVRPSRGAGVRAARDSDASTLRRDVDTADQLEAAAAFGLGPRTAWLLAVRGL